MTRKFDTFIGFSIKAGKVVFGADNLRTYRRRIRLIVLSSDVSERTQRDMIELATKKNCRVIRLLDENLEDIVFKTNCKVIGLTDINLAQAVLDNSNGIANDIGGEINE